MRNICILTVFSLLLSVNSIAQDKKEDIKKITGILQSEKMIDGALDNMLLVLKTSPEGVFKGDHAKDLNKQYMEYLLSETKIITHKLVKEVLINIYDVNFAHDEIKEMFAFYESSTGRKMLEKTPELINHYGLKAPLVNFQ